MRWRLSGGSSIENSVGGFCFKLKARGEASGRKWEGGNGKAEMGRRKWEGGKGGKGGKAENGRRKTEEKKKKKK